MVVSLPLYCFEFIGSQLLWACAVLPDAPLALPEQQAGPWPAKLS